MQKSKARKHRDAFLLMLAETTEIDSRTRWRDAVEILKGDTRYKNLEDDREREDLFRDFVIELEKKELEDRKKKKERVLNSFRKVLEKFNDQNIIDRKSVWVDCRKLFSEEVSKAEYNAVDDTDLRRTFQDFILVLNQNYKQLEKAMRDDFMQELSVKKTQFRDYLQDYVNKGRIAPYLRWKEVVEDMLLMPGYIELANFVSTSERIDGLEINASDVAKEVYEKLMSTVYEYYKDSKRLVKTLLSTANQKVQHDSIYEDMVKTLEQISRGDFQPIKRDKDRVVVTKVEAATEEGEEVEEVQVPSKSEPENKNRNLFTTSEIKALQQLLSENSCFIKFIFEDLLDKSKTDYEEEQRILKKNVSRYIKLLEEVFNLSDHVGMEWEEAKDLIKGRSAYDALYRTDRKQIYLDYMEKLSKQWASKSRFFDSHSSSTTKTEKDLVSDLHSVKDNDKDIVLKGHSKGIVEEFVMVPEKVTEKVLEKEVHTRKRSRKNSEHDMENGDNDSVSTTDEKKKSSKKHKKDKKHKKVCHCQQFYCVHH